MGHRQLLDFPGLSPGAACLVGLLLGGVAWVPLGWHAALLLSRPLPRPWRPVLRAYRELFADIMRLLETGRWT